ncbi:hypothetical protein RSOL_417180 [Rhizoctonia solani AG-3 Rhs1AP]|uniref:Ricin B lectin domain-containing protein n=1 Tax=Rhizoctonia solani AG-3 Rhs1AP TaxID=1086054 RepID=X8JEF8_9AGAM|nr:hypothetical protein RSOL_417180 [Rhizoctonia solani AG-3 Rhs1AP]
MSAEAPAPTPYAKPPSPGTYTIASRAVPSNCLEIHPRNETRAVCSPGDGSNRQLWHIQRFGKGYKIKNAMHNVYLSASSSRENTVVETSTRPTMWNLVRTHDGYAIQYGEEDGIIDLHGGHNTCASVLYLASLDGIKLAPRRWSFVHKSDDTGGEIPETIEDQVDYLRNQIAINHAELAAKDRLLAEKQRELQELRRDGPNNPSAPNTGTVGDNPS